MEITDALDFVRRHHRAVCVTTRSDGRPSTSPVLVAVDGEDRVVISTRETAMKTQHVRERPFASLCVFTDTFFGHWVHIEGDAEVVSLPEAMEGLVDYYRRTSGTHPDWDDYRAAMRRERRVLLRVTPTRVGPQVQG